MKIIKKVKYIPTPAKASIAFLFINILQKGLAFLTSPIYTRILTPEEFGQVSVFLSWYSLIGIIAMFCLSYGVFNNGMLDYEHDRDRFMFSLLILSNIITLSLFIIILFSNKWIQNIINVETSLVLLMFLLFFTQPAFNFWSARQRYEYKYKLSSVVTIITSITSPIVAIICILSTSGDKVQARLFGGESVFIVCYIIIYIYIAYKAKFKIKLNYWKYALVFNLPLIPHYLSNYILNSSDRLMIASLIGDSYAALYSIAYSVASVVTIIWFAINNSLVPYTYEKCKIKDYKSISKITNPIITIYAIACILIIFLAPEAIIIISPKSYHDSIYAIPPIVGGVFFSSLYYIFANIVYYFKKPKYVMIASLISALLNIMLNWILIPRYGYIAAGYTTLICYIIQATIDFIVMRKIVGQSIYNMKYIISLSTIVIIIILISNFIYEYPLIRFGILGCVFISIVLFRNIIIRWINNLRE